MKRIIRRPNGHSHSSRPGAATVELALLAPFLAFIFLIAVDYGRVFYYAITLENAARRGALYGCLDAAHSVDTSGIRTAALTDATDISPAPTITSKVTTDSNSDATVEVTVNFTFQTITNYPGIPNATNLSRKVAMRILP
jgi:Flp pilus assembly protein TadG